MMFNTVRHHTHTPDHLPQSVERAVQKSLLIRTGGLEQRRRMAGRMYGWRVRRVDGRVTAWCVPDRFFRWSEHGRKRSMGGRRGPWSTRQKKDRKLNLQLTAERNKLLTSNRVLSTRPEPSATSSHFLHCVFEGRQNFNIPATPSQTSHVQVYWQPAESHCKQTVHQKQSCAQLQEKTWLDICVRWFHYIIHSHTLSFRFIFFINNYQEKLHLKSWEKSCQDVCILRKHTAVFSVRLW